MDLVTVLNNSGFWAAIGAVGVFIWPVVQFILTRKREQQVHEFASFHRVVEILVSPEPHADAPKLDRQVAAIFELRHFPRYYEVTERILLGLKKSWETSAARRALEEIDLTLKFISHAKKPWIVRRFTSPQTTTPPKP